MGCPSVPPARAERCSVPRTGVRVYLVDLVEDITGNVDGSDVAHDQRQDRLVSLGVVDQDVGIYDEQHGDRLLGDPRGRAVAHLVVGEPEDLRAAGQRDHLTLDGTSNEEGEPVSLKVMGVKACGLSTGLGDEAGGLEHRLRDAPRLVELEEALSGAVLVLGVDALP